MFEFSNNIYFVVYNLYYVGQNDNLEARAGPIYRDGGSSIMHAILAKIWCDVTINKEQGEIGIII
jgi:hypothetical protein